MCKKASIILIVIVAALMFYWIKCQLGVNIFEHFAWEKQFPVLDILQKREVVLRPQPGGVVLRSDFDEIFPYKPWSTLWSRDEGRVEDDLVREGVGGSKCLRVTSRSPRDWAIGHHHRVAVRPGEMFRYTAQVRTTGTASGMLSVIPYDADGRVLHWIYGAEDVSRAAEWRAVARTFTVPEGAAFLRFRLTGAGIGTVWFDDIRFKRE